MNQQIKVRNVKVGDIIEDTRDETYYGLSFNGSPVTVRKVTETTRYYVQGKIQDPHNRHRSLIQLRRIRKNGEIDLAKTTLNTKHKIAHGSRSWLKSMTVTLISRKAGN